MIDQLFSSVTRVDTDRIRFELNPDIIGQFPLYRYRTGFAIVDSPSNMWPSPYRNLNNTGKYLIPSYGDPFFPETIGEFILLIQQRGEPETNSVILSIPGITSEEEPINLVICVIDPDNYGLNNFLWVDNINL